MKATVALVVLVLVAVYGQNCATDGCNAEWDGPCCSQYGYCGKTEDYCKRDKGCVNGCWDDPAPPPPAPTTKAPEPTHNDGGSLGYIHTADRPGMDLPNQPVTVSNEKECQVLCYNNKECVTWAFDSCGTNCWLKNGKPGEVKADCRRSGFISAKRDGTRPTPTPTSAPVPTRNNNNNTGACFPMGSASFKNGNPNNLNQWWCPADQIYGFLGFSYPMEDGNCWGDSNSYATISRDMANMKKKFGAKYLRVYLPECRDTILYKNLVKAGRDNDMAVIPMIFWDWQQNDGKMNAAQNALLGVFKDSEVGAIAPYVIHSVAFGDELGEQGDYWYPKMLSFKAQLAQHGVPITMTDDWDRGIFKQGNSLNDFGKKVNAASNLTNVHIMPYYHPDQCPDAYHFWPYFQSQIDFITRNNMKRPIMVSQTCWNSDRNGGHGRGSHDDARNLDNYKKYWTTFTDNCEYFKQNKVGWFVHAYSDSGEPGFGMLDWNGNPKFDFKPNRC